MTIYNSRNSFGLLANESVIPYRLAIYNSRNSFGLLAYIWLNLWDLIYNSRNSFGLLASYQM